MSGPVSLFLFISDLVSQNGRLAELIFLAVARLFCKLFNIIYQDECKLREKDGSVKGKDFWQINSPSYPTVSKVNSTYIHTYIFIKCSSGLQE